MKELCDLLFELSSEERIRIMNCLREDALKLSHLATRLDMTVTETSRHLQRLGDAELVSKNPDGVYEVTSFGEIILSLLPSFIFFSNNRKYFLGHDVSRLPYRFMNRISELSEYTFSDDVVIVFGHAKDVLLNAEEYIWLQSYQHLIWDAPVVEEKIDQGIDFRFILPLVHDELEAHKEDIKIKQRIKCLDEVDVRVLVTDKEASLSFPYMDGRIDYAAFMSTDLKFRNWCKDLFLYYWKRAQVCTI